MNIIDKIIKSFFNRIVCIKAELDTNYFVKIKKAYIKRQDETDEQFRKRIKERYDI